MSEKCFVKVSNNSNHTFYEVGPFEYSGNQIFNESNSAINWIYKQIGIIKTQSNDAELIKHKWNYNKNDFESTAEIKVEIGNFIFETVILIDPQYHNVINETFATNANTL